MIQFTAEYLRIPHVLAQRYGHDDRELREELLSVGNLALCIAANDYVPGKGASELTWLFNKVKWAIYDFSNLKRQSHRMRWMRIRHFSQLGPNAEKDGAAGYARRFDYERTLADRKAVDPAKKAECDEFVEGLLSRLTDRDRTLFTAVVFQGWKIEHVCGLQGLTIRTANYRMRRCRKVLAKVLEEVEL